MEQRTMTYEEQEAAKKDRLSEVGTLSPCPFCQRPRVQRSSYVRCNPCGVNWLDEEMHLRDYLNRNPAAARSESVRMADTVSRHVVPTQVDANVPDAR